MGRSAYIIDSLKSSFNRSMGREHAVLGSKVCIGSKLLAIAIKTSGCFWIDNHKYSIPFSFYHKYRNMDFCTTTHYK